MAKYFNVNGCCIKDIHYMVDLTSRLEEIKKMIERQEYFAINKGRQYGKTTILQALAVYLRNEYEVIDIDFQNMSTLSYANEENFVKAFSEELLYNIEELPEEIESDLNSFIAGTAPMCSLQALFKVM